MEAHRLPAWRTWPIGPCPSTCGQHGLHPRQLRKFCSFPPGTTKPLTPSDLSQEYVWNYHFYQDGSIEFEIRLTGILQVYASGPSPNPFGTHVAPGVLAQYHQHLFSVRVDPMVDGLHNSVVESDIVPLPDAPTGSSGNFAGNAFVVQDTVLKTASAGARDYNWETDRRWRIVNPARKHYASGKQVGYGLHVKGGMTGMLAQADSWIARRASFPKKALWVVPDVEDHQGGRMWPAGKFVPGTRQEPEDSVSKWSKSEESIEDEDIVLFITVGELASFRWMFAVSVCS
jgi:primary-amine oxidase